MYSKAGQLWDEVGTPPLSGEFNWFRGDFSDLHGPPDYSEVGIARTAKQYALRGQELSVNSSEGRYMAS